MHIVHVADDASEMVLLHAQRLLEQSLVHFPVVLIQIVDSYSLSCRYQQRGWVNTEDLLALNEHKDEEGVLEIYLSKYGGERYHFLHYSHGKHTENQTEISMAEWKKELTITSHEITLVMSRTNSTVEFCFWKNEWIIPVQLGFDSEIIETFQSMM